MVLKVFKNKKKSNKFFQFHAISKHLHGLQFVGDPPPIRESYIHTTDSLHLTNLIHNHYFYSK